MSGPLCTPQHSFLAGKTSLQKPWGPLSPFLPCFSLSQVSTLLSWGNQTQLWCPSRGCEVKDVQG